MAVRAESDTSISSCLKSPSCMLLRWRESGASMTRELRDTEKKKSGALRIRKGGQGYRKEGK